MKNRKLLFVLLMSMIFFFQIKTFGQNPKIQAMFIYNFTKLIDWPASYKTGDFVIGVLGGGPILNEIQNLAASKKVGTQKIKAIVYPNVGAIGKCNILFIPASQSGSFGAPNAATAGKGTLVITEQEGMGKKGACINFVVRNNKQAFELNQSTMASHQLKVSSQLIKLAIIVS